MIQNSFIMKHIDKQEIVATKRLALVNNNDM